MAYVRRLVAVDHGFHGLRSVPACMRPASSYMKLSTSPLVDLATVQFTVPDARFTTCTAAPPSPAGQRSAVTAAPVCPPRSGQPRMDGAFGPGGVGFVFAGT